MVEEVLNKNNGKGTITYSDFSKLDIVVAKIVEIEDIEKSDKLYKIKVQVSQSEYRILVAGLKEYYKKEQLLNKKIVLLANLEPRKIRNIESQGMLLAADDGKSVKLLTIDDENNIEIGAKIR
ncbi:MAG: hypothetical protein QXO21_03440 [Candidatus Anstonellales archaeon]